MLVLAAYYTIGAVARRARHARSPIGVLTGLLVFIPYVGLRARARRSACSPRCCSGTGWPGFLAVLAVYGIGQLLETYVLVPYLVGDRIGLHPLAVIFALLAFGQLFGFAGVLLALPASAALLVGLRHLRAAYFDSPVYGETDSGAHGAARPSSWRRPSRRRSPTSSRAATPRPSRSSRARARGERARDRRSCCGARRARAGRTCCARRSRPRAARPAALLRRRRRGVRDEPPARRRARRGRRRRPRRRGGAGRGCSRSSTRCRRRGGQLLAAAALPAGAPAAARRPAHAAGLGPRLRDRAAVRRRQARRRSPRYARERGLPPGRRRDRLPARARAARHGRRWSPRWRRSTATRWPPSARSPCRCCASGCSASCRWRRRMSAADRPCVVAGYAVARRRRRGARECDC